MSDAEVLELAMRVLRGDVTPKILRQLKRHDIIVLLSAQQSLEPHLFDRVPGARDAQGARRVRSASPKKSKAKAQGNPDSRSNSPSRARSRPGCREILFAPQFVLRPPSDPVTLPSSCMRSNGTGP